METATEDESSLETRFVLPADVVLLPVAELAESLRKQIPHQPGDFAVSRPRMRRPSQIVAPETARLLAEFKEPSRIADAVARYSRAENTDPFSTLESAFEALQSFTARRLLVPSDSDLVRPIEASFVPGQMVAGFEIERVVQALEDTELYQAKSPGAGWSVALKITRPYPNDATLELILREAAVLRHLDGVVAPALVAEGEWQKRRFLACAWQVGVPVSAVASGLRREPDARERLHRLCCDVGEAFARLHERQVVHGDVHPGNVLSGTAITVLDYGLSRLTEADSPFSSAPRSGVAFYYEPELARSLLAGEMPPQASFAGEQYAVAVLFYQLLTGYYPQDFALTAQEFLPQIMSSPPVAFSRRGLEPWPEVEAVLAKALSKKSADRFVSVRRFVDAFVAASKSHSDAPAAATVSKSSRAVDIVIRRFDWDGAWFKDGVPTAPRASFCNGAAGVAYFLHRVALTREDPALLALADAWAQRANPQAPDAFDSVAQESSKTNLAGGSPYHGPAGLHAVRALIAHARSDARSSAVAVNDFVAAIPDDWTTPGLTDLFLGVAGASPIVSLLHSLVGGLKLEDLARQFLERGEHAVRPGVKGMAHGMEGWLQANLRACRTLSIPLPAWMLSEISRLVRAQEPSESGWCRGTAGSLLFWTLVHECTGAEEHLRLAERAAKKTWEHSSVHVNLCCGLTGRSFALLRFYQWTGERVWLDRARRLADLAAGGASVDEAPWSLFKGGLGVALLVNELEFPERAALPFLG